MTAKDLIPQHQITLEQHATGATISLVDGKQDLLNPQLLDLDINVEIHDLCLIDPVLRLAIQKVGEDHHLFSSDTHDSQLFFPWLPRGNYRIRFQWPLHLPTGTYEMTLAWGTVRQVRAPDLVLPVEVKSGIDGEMPRGTWTLAPDTASRIAGLSWQQGMRNWFHRHFCHAAVVIGETFLKDSPLLQGRILDIGAGEGITDLGLYLRYQPQELVAMDIVDYLVELPRVARENDLPLDALPERFRFIQASCENVPYGDASFDVVISWGSVEHINGGYEKTLDEVFRVLKPGGLFFINPGLYYSDFGSHLGEFSDTPHLHLKLSEEQLRELVLNSNPDIMDRSGFDVSNENYWRFYKELNRIRVAEFELTLKDYGYEVLRAAIRANDIVEYSAELQGYSILDLAVEDAFFTLRKPD